MLVLGSCIIILMRTRYVKHHPAEEAHLLIIGRALDPRIWPNRLLAHLTIGYSL